MSVFIADHTGKIPSIGRCVRPVHIGAAMVDPDQRGPEPDCLTEPNISATVAFADLRLHNYVARLDIPNDQVIALMQYRRMFYIGTSRLFSAHERRLYRKSQNSGADCFKAPLKKRPAYLRRLSMLTDKDLSSFLGGDAAVMSGHALSEQGLQPGFLAGVEELYPGDVRYKSAWFKMREVLEARVDPRLVKQQFDAQSQAYFHNAMVTTFFTFKAYADFLFDILGELHEYEDVPRVFGYLAERIQSVYVDHIQANDPTFTVRRQPLIFYV